MPVVLHYKRGLWALLLPALLAGCFQQRGESFQPASSTMLPSDAAPTVEMIVPDNGGAAATPTLEIIVPGPDSDAQALSTPTALPITVFMQPTRAQETPLPAGLTPTEADVTQVQGQFITPVSPLGPVFESATPPGLQPAETTGLVTPTALALDAAGGLASSDCTYTVQPGDNLYRIALSQDTTLNAMRAANPELTGDAPILQPGQVLRLPDCAGDPAVSTAVPVVIVTPTVPAVPGQQQVYRVQPGDTLYAIALRFNTTIAALEAANDLPNPNRLDVGQEIIIPAN
jgi:LysM repeat protein